MTKEDLEQIRALMREEIKPINERLDKMDERIDCIDEQIAKIKEDIEEIKYETKKTRVTVNEIGKWVEINATPSNPYPVKDAAF